MTKSLAAICGLILIPVALSGCSTLTDSSCERAYNVGRVEKYNAMLFNEDFDDFWLIDQPSHLSQWMVR